MRGLTPMTGGYWGLTPMGGGYWGQARVREGLRFWPRGVSGGVQMSHREDSRAAPSTGAIRANGSKDAGYLAQREWHAAWTSAGQDVSNETKETAMMSPVSAAVAG